MSHSILTQLPGSPLSRGFITARMQRTTECSVLCACLWLFLFVYEISREPLNGFAPNSQERRVWSLALTSLKVKVKGQGHHGQKRHFSAFWAAYVQFMFGKTSLSSSFWFLFMYRSVTLQDTFVRILVYVGHSLSCCDDYIHSTLSTDMWLHSVVHILSEKRLS